MGAVNRKSQIPNPKSHIPNPKRILIVEDHHPTAKMMRDMLEFDGYQVSMAFDGQEGLNKARAERPDLILLDVMLPKLDGFKVARLLKSDKLYRHIPILILTVRAGEDDVTLSRGSGADGYLTKPIDPDDLLERIKGLLSERGLG